MSKVDTQEPVEKFSQNGSKNRFLCATLAIYRPRHFRAKLLSKNENRANNRL